MRKLETLYWPPPTPIRRFDWMATWDDYESGHPIGFGATEDEAIADLHSRTQEHEEGRKALH